MRRPVAFVSDTTEFAGAEFYMVVLIEALRGRCDFVAILSDRAPDETRLRLEQAGAAVEIVPGLRRRPSPAVVPRLLRAIRSADPALVHVNLSDQGDGLAALLAARLSRRPSLATLNLVLPLRAGWRESLSTAALRRAGPVVAVSNSVAAYLERKRVETRVVRYGIPPPEPVADARAALGLRTSDLVVGGVGRLREQKGWDVLCLAAALVRRELPHVVFVVIGGGSERERLQQLPECGEVRFLGYLTRASSLMPAFDVLVVPSRYEGLGLTPVEAMLLGVPIIASNVEGLAEAVGDSGLLVPADEPQALADAITRLASDPSHRAALADRGKRRARDLFSVERMAAETLAVYESLVR